MAPSRTITSLEIHPLAGLPLIEAGDDLAAQLVTAAGSLPGLKTGDVLVVAQKIVSKAAGLFADLAEIAPSRNAIALAAETGKDSRLVELILRESRAIVARKPGVLITVHVSGAVLANAGIDRSNVPPDAGKEPVLLLPRDPDGAAASLREALAMATGTDLGVIIADSWGRPWRLGTCGFALGAAGLAPLHDYRGEADLFDRANEISLEAVADELAGAASLVMGQSAEGIPAALIRGFARRKPHGQARDLLRPVEEDLFR